MTVNDGEVASDAKAHAKFSGRVKSFVANPLQTYRAMYKDAISVFYNGRLLVTLNDDTQSITMVPDLATNMEDKVMVLAFQNTAYEFPPKHVLEPMIAAELPAFLRWLTDWEVPAEIVGGNRLGVKSYINERLRLKALNAGQAGSLSEIIDLWTKRNVMDCDYWIGTATEFYALATADETLRLLLSKHTARSLGIRFAQAAKIKDSGIEVEEASTKRNTYKILVKRNRKQQAVRVKP